MSYKRGIPYVYGSEDDEGGIVLHFWGEHDDSCKDTVWYGNYKTDNNDLDGIKMTMKDLDEIVIKRVGEIINEESETDKYKKIEKMFNESKKFRFGKKG